MGWTWKSFLEEFVQVCNADYRSDADRQVAVLEGMERVIHTLLEKLRDEHGEC